MRRRIHVCHMRLSEEVSTRKRVISAEVEVSAK
jgi:hypothetical protein